MEFILPPALKGADFICWIPCASGRLNFSEISPEKSRKASDPGSSLKILNEKRYLVAHSVTGNKDFGIFNRSKNGNFRYCFFIQQNTECPYQFNGHFFWWHKDDISKELTKQIREAVNELRNDEIENFSKVNEWIDAYDTLLDKLRTDTQSTRYSIKFNLEANGLLFLNKPVLTSTKKAGSIKRPTLNEIEIETLANQTFYAIRQCFHKHKHHEESEDTLTIAHKIDILKKAYLKKNIGVGLLEDLRSSMVTMHRSNSDHSSLKKACGYQEYVQSLITTLRSRGFLTKKTAKVQRSYFKALSNSIDNLAEQRKFEAERKQRARTSKRILFLGIVATLGPILVFLRERIYKLVEAKSSFDLLDDYARPFAYIATTPNALLIGVIAFASLLFIWWRIEIKYIHPIIAFKKWVVSLGAWLVKEIAPKAIVCIIGFLIALFISTLAIYINPTSSLLN